MNSMYKLGALAAMLASTTLASAKPVAEESALVIDLLPGHPVYHEAEDEAGVVMAISITLDQSNAANLTSLCEELQAAAGLANMTSSSHTLKTIFVIPYKRMAIEGHYFRFDDELDSGTLVPGNRVAREVLNNILSLANIPPNILDETNVEQEISCELNGLAWHVRWEDVRPVDGEKPDTVIEHAHRRFITVYQSVLEHGMATPVSASGAVLAQASADGRLGPRTFTDETLNQSLVALNNFLQDKYVQEDMLTALIDEQAPEFATAAAASAAVPTIAFAEAAKAASFGYAVFDDRSLNRGLSLFNTELALRDEIPFIQIARAAAAKGDAFALAAASAGLDAKMERRRQEMAGASNGFGDPISGDASLQNSLVALNQWMRDHEAREVVLAAAVPPVNADSFATVMAAMAYSY